MDKMKVTPFGKVLDDFYGKVGVKKSQFSRLERGYSITIPTVSKVFCALGINSGTLDLGSAGRVALW